jgi:alpha-glucosidase
MVRLRDLSLIFLFFFSSSYSQWTSLGNLDSSRVEGNALLVFSADRQLTIRILSSDLVRVRLSRMGEKEVPASPAVIKSDWAPRRFDVDNSFAYLEIKTGKGTVRVAKNPVRISFHDQSGAVINRDDEKGMAWDGKEVRVWKEMPQGEFYYGFGEKSGRLNKRETHLTMWNTDIPAYKADTDPLYESIPFFYGIRNGKAYGIFFDNSYRSSFDMGKESETRYSFGAAGGELNYYFFFGPSPKEILSRFTELAGRMPLPPLWSLGYQQCRWSYTPEKRVREIAENFRARKIPADVIYLDIDYMEGYRIFTWNKERFPDPAGMIRDLSKDGFRIAVIVDPGIKQDSSYSAFRSGLGGDHFVKYPDGRTFIGKVWPGECAFPDFSSTAARAWWGAQFKILTDAGVRGWWNDMNEPSVFDVPTKTVDLSVIHYDEGRMTTHEKNHNTYGMLMTQATYEGVRGLVPNERPFVLTRASYAGGQRYSAAWTGDNIASWEHLQLAVPMCLNLSISGQPFVGSDIGGFIGYPSGELFARWLQLGVFNPLMRAHSVINERNKEPWEYGPEYEAVNRTTIELRYRLLPYIYSTMVQASRTGIPAMRPLVFEYPEDPEYMWNETEFMFGDQLLVAPVLWERAATRSLRLPEGTWYDFWTGKKYQGRSWVTVDAPLDRIPLFVKGGAVIPMQPVVQYVGEKPANPLTFAVFPGDRGTSFYYEDDGISFAYEKGEYIQRSIFQKGGDSRREVVLGKSEGTFEPAARYVIVRMIDVVIKPGSVVKGSSKLNLLSQGDVGKKEGWWYDEVSHEVLISFPESRSEISLSIR